MRLELPLRTRNPLNGQHGHWSVQAKRRKAERGAALMAVRAAGGQRIPPPWLVTLTRVGPRTMDDEGAIASLKSIRDGVADALGVDDGDTERIRFEYHQERGPYAVTVEIASR